MKTVHPWIAVTAAAIMITSSVHAGQRDGGRGHYPRHVKMSNHHNASNWVVPLVIGGVLGYVLSEPHRESVTYVERTPVVYAPQPMYQERWVYFSECDCQRKVLVSVR